LLGMIADFIVPLCSFGDYFYTALDKKEKNAKSSTCLATMFIRRPLEESHRSSVSVNFSKS
jgi:hypothetical protein